MVEINMPYEMQVYSYIACVPGKDVIPIMIYRPLLGSLYMRGPPESPAQGSCTTKIGVEKKVKQRNLI